MTKRFDLCRVPAELTALARKRRYSDLNQFGRADPLYKYINRIMNEQGCSPPPGPRRGGGAFHL